MKELSFSHGRLSFSTETFEMQPCLPDRLESRIQTFYLDADGLMETHFVGFDALVEQRNSKSLIWLHVSGTPGDEFWQHLSKAFNLSDEEIKYIRSPHLRSVADDFESGLFWSLQRPSTNYEIDALESINFFMLDKALLTRQFSHEAAFTISAHHLMAKGAQCAGYTVDVLAAQLVEDILKSYLDLLKLGGTKLESIQNKIIRNPGKAELHLINRSQQIIWIYLNAIWPIELVLQSIIHSRSSILTKDGNADFRARLEEANSVLRLFETYRAMSYNLMDVYVSGLGLRTNETTMVLTIIATLFLPPTLIAGIYGMNFQIPEIHVSGGYYWCLAAMFGVSGGLLVWLWRRGFISFL